MSGARQPVGRLGAARKRAAREPADWGGAARRRRRWPSPCGGAATSRQDADEARRATRARPAGRNRVPSGPGDPGPRSCVRTREGGSAGGWGGRCGGGAATAATRINPPSSELRTASPGGRCSGQPGRPEGGARRPQESRPFGRPGLAAGPAAPGGPGRLQPPPPQRRVLICRAARPAPPPQKPSAGRAERTSRGWAWPGSQAGAGRAGVRAARSGQPSLRIRPQGEAASVGPSGGRAAGARRSVPGAARPGAPSPICRPHRGSRGSSFIVNVSHRLTGIAARRRLAAAAGLAPGARAGQAAAHSFFLSSWSP